MEKQIKTIGVLTSGGDAPGMNAAVRAVVRTGLHKGFRMIGIQRGYNGLLNGECFEMNLRSVSNIISAGGTILYTARCLEFKTKERQDTGAEKCRELGIDALVVIGGDGSYRGARELAHRGIPMLGLPGTIAKEIACTEYPNANQTPNNTAQEILHNHPGQRPLLVLAAEGIGHSQEIANEIQARTGIDTRATILGHVQRGGSPTLRDRVNASAMGYHAVCLLEEGKYNRIVGMKGEHLVDYPVDEALEMTKTLDPVLIDVCNTISI